MIGMLSRFAASGPVVHITPLPLFKIHSIDITNAMLYGWICALVLIVVFVLTARKVTVKPKGGFIQVVEAGVEFITNLVESSFEDKERGRKFVPYFVTLFFYLLFN